MGYFGYLCEKEPDAAEANKDKKAELTGIRFDGTDEELSAEYLMDDTSAEVNLAETAMQPGEKRTLIIEAWSLESYTSARDWAHSNDEQFDLEGLDHLYLNEPWDVFPDNISQTEKEYGVAPIFLRHAKEIMGEDAFYGFLREVYETYTMKIVHTEDILKILRKHNDSEEITELIGFYFAISSSR